MIDIKLLRTNPELVKENIKKKFQDEKLPLVDEVIELDEKIRKLKAEGDELRAYKNKASSMIGQLMREKKIDEANNIKKELALLPEKISENEAQTNEIEARIRKIMMTIPNIIDPTVPIGRCNGKIPSTW